MLKRFFNLCLALSLTLSFSVRASESVVWLQVDVPPFYIVDGEYAGQGIVDQISSLLQRRLSQYSHKYQIASFKRAEQLFRYRGVAYHASYFKTPERLKFAYFSELPTTLSPPIGITIKKENLPRFETDTPLSLSVLMHDKTIRGGVVKGRSYGKAIDALLARHENDSNMFFRSTTRIYSGSFGMLMADRFDYLLGYPAEAVYVSQLEKTHDVITLPIQESQNYLRGYMACSKNELGREIIDQVDQILREKLGTEAYKAIFQRWLDDYSVKPFSDAYEAMLLETLGSQGVIK